MYDIPYTRHHKPLLIRSRSWMQAIHKDRIFWRNLLKNKEMVFGNGVKNIKAAACNGARTVHIYISCAVRHFYGTEFDTWAGWRYWKLPNLSLEIFLCLYGHNLNPFLKKNCTVRTKKLHWISWKKSQFFSFKFNHKYRIDCRDTSLGDLCKVTLIM